MVSRTTGVHFNYCIEYIAFNHYMYRITLSSSNWKLISFPTFWKHMHYSCWYCLHAVNTRIIGIAYIPENLFMHACQNFCCFDAGNLGTHFTFGKFLGIWFLWGNYFDCTVKHMRLFWYFFGCYWNVLIKNIYYNIT